MPDNLDIKGVIERSTKKATVDELAKKGFQNVKVLDEEALNNLIMQAVDSVIASKVTSLSEEEKQKIYTEARAELEKLKKEFATIKRRAELAEDAKAKLAGEVENLQAELETAKKSQDVQKKEELEQELESKKTEILNLQKEITRLKEETERIPAQNLEELQAESRKKGFQEGIEVQKSVLEELHKEISKLKGELEAKTRNEIMLVSQLEREKGRATQGLTPLDSKHPTGLEYHLLEKVEGKLSGSEYLYADLSDKKELPISSTVSRPVFERLPDFGLETNVFSVGVEKKVFTFRRDALDKLRGIRVP